MINTIIEAANSNRKSIRRAIARFCVRKHVQLSEREFETIVRRTQESGYESAIKFFTIKFAKETNWKKRQLLYQFSIEYNTEMYVKAFPKANKTIMNIMAGINNPEEHKFFKETLYDIVKANPLQVAVIDKYVS